MTIAFTPYLSNSQRNSPKDSSTPSDEFKLLMLISLSIILFPVVLLASVAWTATDSTRSF